MRMIEEIAQLIRLDFDDLTWKRAFKLAVNKPEEYSLSCYMDML